MFVLLSFTMLLSIARAMEPPRQQARESKCNFAPGANHYLLLGMPGKVGDTDADKKTIKEAYKKAALCWHPDKHQNNAQATEYFKRISRAYETLSNADTKRAYDRTLPAVNPNPPPPPPPPLRLALFFGHQGQTIREGDRVILKQHVRGYSSQAMILGTSFREGMEGTVKEIYVGWLLFVCADGRERWVASSDNHAFEKESLLCCVKVNDGVVATEVIENHGFTPIPRGTRGVINAVARVGVGRSAHINFFGYQPLWIHKDREHMIRTEQVPVKPAPPVYTRVTEKCTRTTGYFTNSVSDNEWRWISDSGAGKARNCHPHELEVDQNAQRTPPVAPALNTRIRLVRSEESHDTSETDTFNAQVGYFTGVDKTTKDWNWLVYDPKMGGVVRRTDIPSALEIVGEPRQFPAPRQDTRIHYREPRDDTNEDGKADEFEGYFKEVDKEDGTWRWKPKGKKTKIRAHHPSQLGPEDWYKGRLPRQEHFDHFRVRYMGPHQELKGKVGTFIDLVTLKYPFANPAENVGNWLWQEDRTGVRHRSPPSDLERLPVEIQVVETKAFCVWEKHEDAEEKRSSSFEGELRERVPFGWRRMTFEQVRTYWDEVRPLVYDIGNPNRNKPDMPTFQLADGMIVQGAVIRTSGTDDCTMHVIVRGIEEPYTKYKNVQVHRRYKIGPLYRTLTRTLNEKDQPEQAADVLHVFAEGDVVEVVEIAESWTRVRGRVSGDDLRGGFGFRGWVTLASKLNPVGRATIVEEDCPLTTKPWTPDDEDYYVERPWHEQVFKRFDKPRRPWAESMDLPYDQFAEASLCWDERSWEPDSSDGDDRNWETAFSEYNEAAARKRAEQAGPCVATPAMMIGIRIFL